MIEPGHVYLVGAGPGDPGLITVRGLELLCTADVIVHDRLIPLALLGRVRTEAEVIDVGKHPGRPRFPQEAINALLIERARAGRSVVRLKGGDPFMFGRGGEELAACQAAEIPCVVVPGVSSILAVPAAVGIPLTHRGLVRSVAVISGESDGESGSGPIPYEALVHIDTLVIMMGLGRLSEIAAGLIDAGRSPTTSAVCIESGCTPNQQAVFAELGKIGAYVAAAGLTSPALTVIGEVVRMASADGGADARSMLSRFADMAGSS